MGAPRLLFCARRLGGTITALELELELDVEEEGAVDCAPYTGKAPLCWRPLTNCWYSRSSFSLSFLFTSSTRLERL